MSQFTPDQIKILTRSRNDFSCFIDKIFSQSFKYFIRGEHVFRTARFLGEYLKTMRISAKGHFKSTSLYAHFMWRLLFEGASNNVEAHYFSYQEQMAGYHINKIKRMIQENPYYQDMIDLKPLAESTLKYTWDRTHITTLEPHGLLAFKRGIHGDLIYVDDPFQDPENELTPTTIYKINEVFKSNILDMPKEKTGELHVVGTAQTKEDFFFDKKITKRFQVKLLPAIENGKVLWTEYMSMDELMAKKEERTTRIFEREYLCNPTYSSKAYFSKDYLEKQTINSNLANLKLRTKHNIQNNVIAGFDIGKKKHPSHLSVFEIRNNKWIMIHQKWMDGWSYSNGSSFFEPRPTQLEYLKLAIENFGIDKLFFDNTRGEFEAFIEQGLVPPQMIPITMTLKIKHKISTEFDRVVDNKEIELINDNRTINQICAVTSDLISIESSGGHGDSFWSIGLALLGRKDVESKNKKEHSASSGGRSLFEQGQSIPVGW